MEPRYYGRGTHGPVVFPIKSWADYGCFDVVPNDGLVLKGVQGWWQSLLDMTVPVSRSLHLQTANIDDCRLIIDAGVVEWKLRRQSVKIDTQRRGLVAP